MLPLYEKVVDGFAWVAVALLLAVMIGIGADVAARFFFNQPIGWMLEFVQHSVLCILFLGMPWLTRQGGHVSIDLLVDVLPITGRRLLIASGRILAGIISGFLSWWAVTLTVDNFQRGVETNGIYPIQRGWLIGVIALGLTLTALEFFRTGYGAFRASDEAILNRHGEPGVEP